MAMLPAPDLFSDLDRIFASFIAEKDGREDCILLTCAALASRAVAQGDSCLALPILAGKPWPPEEAPGLGFLFPELPEILAGLRQSSQVGEPGDFRPLILDGERLYLHRFHAYETAVARALGARLRPAPGWDEESMRRALDRLFPPGDPGSEDGQRQAAARAGAGLFSVISGGPGTGKTHTVARILALLLSVNPGERIALCAPTGKAAARLGESVGRALRGLGPAAPKKIPAEASTLHRLLGARGRGGEFSHNEKKPLPLDTLVVDEASMVDLPLMYALVQALAPGCRLILLGDRDQLSSVEPGSVFSDICGAPPAPSGKEEGLAGAITVLTENFRFTSGSGIHQLARLILAGDAKAALELAREPGREDLAFIDARDPEALSSRIREEALAGYSSMLRARSPEEMLAAREDFAVLTALREGRLGLSGLNAFLTSVFARENMVRPASGPFFHGRPLLVTKNDYATELMNGDMGAIFEGQAHFPSPEGSPRSFPPALLPALETAWALTVHKSQGSEFQTVLAVLPEDASPVATRELLYTAVTRARKRVVIAASPASFAAAVEKRTQRSSGLGLALWGSPGADNKPGEEA